MKIVNSEDRKMPLSRRDFLKQVALVSGAALLSSCKIQTPLTGLLPAQDASKKAEGQMTAYLEAIYAKDFKIESVFWSQRLKGIIENWIPHCYDKLSDLNLPEGGINNFIQAAQNLSGKPAKAHVGYWFSNAYVLNTVEAMCNALMVDPLGDAGIIRAQKAIRAKLDEWLPIILSAQEPDGYLQTWTTLGSTPRWSDKLGHEGYVAGYFLEAAIAHYRMTNKTDATLYDAAKRLADCWCDNLGPAPKKTWWDGHQEMEQALTRFARFVNAEEGFGKGDKYAELAKFLLDSRQGGEEYDQSHALPIHQTEAVGHAVRAAYMYSGMTDVAMLTNSPEYFHAVNVLWDELVNEKMYLTGGIGSEGSNEGFGNPYALPNNSYCESCASCGMLFFGHKMNLAYQDGKYADLMEQVLYNGIFGSLDLEGRNYTYTNPLTQDFQRYDWHNVPCCVGNIARTMLTLPTWMYAKSSDSLYINLFIGSTVTIDNVAGASLEIVQRTDYPWKGHVSITVNPSTAKDFTIKIRVPNRSISTCYTMTPEINGITSLSVNGAGMTPTMNQGYIALSRTWEAGDQIEFDLPLEVQRVKADHRVWSDNNRVALQYGPLVYNHETVDLNGANPLSLNINPNAALSAQWDGDLLGGVMAIRGAFADGTALVAIPNYARNNRGGRSLVWMREQPLAQPSEFVAWYKFDETSGTMASNASGNSSAATLNASTTWAEGKFGNAVKLDGIKDYVSLPAGILENIDDFTIAAWVNLEATSTWSRIFDFGSGTGSNMFLTPRSNTGTVRFAITTSGAGGEQQINSGHLVKKGLWQHIAVTRSSEIGILYMDGVEVARNSNLTLKPSDLGPTAANYIGKSQYEDPYLKGLVDDFRIYSRALSAAEIVGLTSGS
jgi:DUF1680 family protein